MLKVKLRARPILSVVGIILLYWLFESIAMVYIFREGDLIGQLLNPSQHELWMRIPPISLIIVIYLYARHTITKQNRIIADLNETLAKVKTLSGLLPICAWCKKIRDDQGYWNSVEEYISGHTQAEFSHGMCPACFEKIVAEEDSKESNNSKVS